MRSLGALLLALTLAAGLALPSSAVAQEHTPLDAAATAAATGEAPAPVDVITPHITDSHELELPYWKPPFYTAVHLPVIAPVSASRTRPLGNAPAVTA